MVGNVHAKRSARIHSMFNIAGVTWMLFMIPLFLNGIQHFMIAAKWGDPFSGTEAGNLSATVALAVFHTVFNLLNVLLLIGFVPLLVKIAIRTVKSRGESDEEFHLDYISQGILATPDLSIVEARKEVAKFGKITSRMSEFVQRLMKEHDKKEKANLYNKIKKYEEITDRVEVEVAKYLGKVSQNEMSDTASIRVRSMLSIVNDLERVGDIFYQMSKTIERKEEEKIWFTQEQRNELQEMFHLVDEAFEIMVENLNVPDYEGVSLHNASNKENEINEFRNKLRIIHLKNMEKEDYNFKSGLFYNDLFSSLEKVGDHLINVSEAVTGRI